MILAKTVPIYGLKKAIYETLAGKQSMTVHRVVPPKAKFPYMTIDDIIAKPDDTKVNVLWRMTATVNIWATEQQDALVDEALNDMTEIFSQIGTTLDVGTDYRIADCNIGIAETFAEQTTGFHGLMQLEFLLEEKP